MLDEMQWRYPQMFEDVLKKQLQYAPALRQADVDYQTALYNNAVGLSLKSAPQYAAAEQGIVNQYAPQFGQTYAALGARVNEGLAAGYDLGDELSREVTQSIRGAQTARGNYLGPRPRRKKPAAPARPQSSTTSASPRQNYLRATTRISMMGAWGSATNPVSNTTPARRSMPRSLPRGRGRDRARPAPTDSGPIGVFT
jgi:hypothetical protein